MKIKSHPDHSQKVDMAKSIILQWPYLTEQIGRGFDGWLASIVDCLKSTRHTLGIVNKARSSAVLNRKRANAISTPVKQKRAMYSQHENGAATEPVAESLERQCPGVSTELTASTSGNQGPDAAEPRSDGSRGQGLGANAEHRASSSGNQGPDAGEPRSSGSGGQTLGANAEPRGSSSGNQGPDAAEPRSSGSEGQTLGANAEPRASSSGNQGPDAAEPRSDGSRGQGLGANAEPIASSSGGHGPGTTTEPITGSLEGQGPAAATDTRAISSGCQGPGVTTVPVADRLEFQGLGATAEPRASSSGGEVVNVTAIIEEMKILMKNTDAQRSHHRLMKLLSLSFDDRRSWIYTCCTKTEELKKLYPALFSRKALLQEFFMIIKEKKWIEVAKERALLKMPKFTALARRQVKLLDNSKKLSVKQRRLDSILKKLDLVLDETQDEENAAKHRAVAGMLLMPEILGDSACYMYNICEVWLEQ